MSTTNDSMCCRFFAADIKARKICADLKKHSYKEYSNVTWEEFLMTKFGLWTYAQSNTDNTFHSHGKTAEKSASLLQVEKAIEITDGNLTCHVSILENEVGQGQPVIPVRFNHLKVGRWLVFFCPIL